MCVIMYQTGFFIGSCWLLVSLGEDITCELQTLNEIDANAIELTERFWNYVQLQSETKQLHYVNASYRIGDVYFTIFVHFC